ncbi:hypothetical protein [Sediminivirga luteola]|uniref:hypothetical protein n=1 Tax=Sediminivirga luteola TaxID=1774748 RepID=UPI001669534F|nr:hypothetical protein [Sediminivirga luteola]
MGQQQCCGRAKTGLVGTHYRQLERGYWKKDQPANPSIKLLVQLAQTFEVQVGELLPRARRLKPPNT